MTAAADDAVRARLLASRAAVVRRLAALRSDFDGIVEASADSNADDEHDPEGSTIAFERSQVAALAKQAELQLAETEAALARLDTGTYGVCARCGGPIAAARLDARPTARTCVSC
ncbi:MAG: DnaK suppressor protein [Nocardioidaceae bacterium]|nr:DnaK suppressor protein [Nocardioidaceae bacterium]